VLPATAGTLVRFASRLSAASSAASTPLLATTAQAAGSAPARRSPRGSRFLGSASTQCTAGYVRETRDALTFFVAYRGPRIVSNVSAVRPAYFDY
jgi:hypothetical protein